MSIFDSLGKKATELAQSAAKKSGELVETTKLSLAVNSEEDKITKNFTEIGKIAYEKYVSSKNAEPEFLSLFEEISASKNTIARLKSQIMAVKNIKLCTNCSVEIEKGVGFCPKCGSKQEEPQSEAVVSETAVKNCSKCNAEVVDGAAFCASCGSKIDL
jgi:RNA polymerase subunit RPABC4/transcription elongation factor Spt4